MELRASLKGFFKPSKGKIVVFLLVFFISPFPVYSCSIINDSHQSPSCNFIFLPFMIPVMFFLVIVLEAQIYSMISLSLYTVVSYVFGCFSAWFVARRGKKDFIAIGLTYLWLSFHHYLFSGMYIDYAVPATTAGTYFDPWGAFGESLGPVVLFGSIYMAYRIWKYRKSSTIKTA